MKKILSLLLLTVFANGAIASQKTSKKSSFVSVSICVAALGELNKERDAGDTKAQLASYDFYSKVKNINFKISDSSRKILQERMLLDSHGEIHQSARRATSAVCEHPGF